MSARLRARLARLRGADLKDRRKSQFTQADLEALMAAK